MRGVNHSVETVNAAAVAIVSAESRVQQVAVPVNPKLLLAIYSVMISLFNSFLLDRCDYLELVFFCFLFSGGLVFWSIELKIDRF